MCGTWLWAGDPTKDIINMKLIPRELYKVPFLVCVPLLIFKNFIYPSGVLVFFSKILVFPIQT